MNIKLNLKRIIFKLIRIIYKGINKYISIDDKTILFISYHGKGYLCNPKYLHKYMYEHEEYSNYKYIWAVKNNKNINIKNAKVIKYAGIKYFYYLARSKYWIVNCKLPGYVIKRQGQIYLQTWHGTPLKRLAYDIKIGDKATFYRSKMSRESMLKTYDKDVERYDYFISPNRFSTEKFETAFKISKEKLIESGYPRNDFISNITEQEIDNLKEKYNITKDKKVILYAPTWRDNSFSDKGYIFKLQVDFKLWKDKLEEEYVVIFKPHYLIFNKYVNNDLKGFLYSIDEDVDINELYVISDILITDYSSVLFDYAILNRPIIFYMYDLDDYKENIRGFYLDVYNDLPGEIIKTEEKVINTVLNIERYKLNNKEKLYNFNEKFNYLHNGKCCKNVLDKVIKR